MAYLKIKLVGSPEIELDGRPLYLEGRIPVALLAYLAVTGELHTRDALAALFWPEHGQARTQLRNNLWVIKRALGTWSEAWLYSDHEMIGLKPNAALWVDVAHFNTQLAAGHMHPGAALCSACLAYFNEAVALYRDDFLAGFTLRASPAFDEWQFFQQEGLRRGFATVLEKLVQHHRMKGEFIPAIHHARRWLALDPLHEPAHRALMQLYAASGEYTAALRQYQTCVRHLQAELQAQPDPETEALYQSIKNRQQPPPVLVSPKRPAAPVSNHPTALPATRTLVMEPSPPNNLLEQLTPLVGREQERSFLQSFLRRSDVRLVTLTGTGGIGKTRLALQVAADLLESFADGAYFVPLALIHEANLVLMAIAQTLGVREGGSRTLVESVASYLHDKALLLVLDNFEHVISAAPLITDLLARCPHLKILITSREVLHLRGEHEYSVPVLAVPTSRPSTAPDTLSQYAAVQLFIQRAQVVKPDFAVDNASAGALAEICARLDGLPLAIELAAARIKFFSPQVLLKKLSGPGGPTSLKLLQNGARDLPERHKTLRRTIAWSYELLIADEQALFRKLCVFVGGFTLEAAEAVYAADGTLPFDVLEGIASLVNKSLVNQIEQPDGEPRFTMLETIREFGLELLQANDELAAGQRAHAEYYTTFVLTLLADTFGSQRAAIFNQLEIEHDNIRATLRWATAAQAWPLTIRLVGPMQQLWYFRGHYAEGRERVEHILALTGAMTPSLELSMAIFCAGFLAHAQSDFRAARLRYEQCLQMSRQHGYLWSQSHAAALLANVAFEQGCYEEANCLLDEGLRAGEQLGTELWHCGVMRANKANHTLLLGHFAEAQTFCEQALAIHQEIGEKWAIAQIYGFRGDLAYFQGDYGAACALCDQSDLYNREVNDPRQTASNLDLRGLIAIEQGELGAGQGLLIEALKLRRILGNQHDLALSFQNLAQLAVAQGQPARALHLAGAAAALRTAIGMVLPPMLLKLFDRTVRAAQQTVSVEAAAIAWQAGEKMRLDEAVAYALVE